MAKQTPETTFAEAQQAMAAADWETFFGCLSPTDLRRLLKNGLSLALNVGDRAGLEAICAPYGLDLTEIYPAWAAGDRHAYPKAITRGLKPVSDLPGLMATLERYCRQSCGGGSVSSSLFVGESLQNLEVEGDRAWAIRQVNETWTEPIGFEQTQGDWRIRLFGSRRSPSKNG